MSGFLKMTFFVIPADPGAFPGSSAKQLDQIWVSRRLRGYQSHRIHVWLVYLPISPQRVALKQSYQM